MEASLIFLIDDDDALREVLCEELKCAGHCVHAFVDPRDALRRLEETRPSAIIVDQVMGDMNGAEFIEAARSAGHDVPTVLMTGDDRTLRRPPPRVTPLSKPFDVERLFTALQTAAGLVPRAPRS